MMMADQHHTMKLGSFNRTSLELKPQSKRYKRDPIKTFNRTSLELKQPSQSIIPRRDFDLLIEPVWN